MRKSILLLFVLIVCASCLSLKAQVKLQPLFSDNMVLQQQTTAPIWGETTPSGKVWLTTSWDGKEYEAVADEKGHFLINVATPKAGGPYTLTFTTRRGKANSKKYSRTLRNVMIGEVWLCGGQSNMQLEMYSIKNSQQEIADASNHPNIRLLHVKTTTAANPSRKVNAKNDGWEVCSAEAVPDFSATGYFFGRELEQNLNVPVGIIQSCLGSTFAEPWISAASLAKMPYFDEAIAKVSAMPADSLDREKQYADYLNEWEVEVKNMDLYDPTAGTQQKASALDWLDIKVPGLFEDQLKEHYGAYDGIVWYRRTIDIPASWEGKECRLCLGAVDDDDLTFFNGTVVGSHMGVAFNREYTIPASLVKAGKAEIAIRVHDTGGLGGFYSNDARIECGQEKVLITGDWKFLATISEKDLPFYPTNLNTDTNVPSALYNGMIAPLAPYAIKGALWYQGESSVGRAYQYRELLPLLINDWHKSFGREFPFYIVQLANHMTEQSDPAEESTWAELREAQLKTAQCVDGAGLATTIDIGEADDIHPKNKQEVGRRLGLLARANTYGERVEYSGPQFESYKIENGRIRLHFSHAEGLKVGRGDNELKGFTIAGPDRKFHWAKATISADGKSIVVESDEVSFPVAVRYGWANNPYCNLVNKQNLPASPFRTDEWPGLSIGNY